MIAYLKDQLQEMKAKTDMENRYVKKDTELQVAQVQKKCSNNENDLQNEIEVSSNSPCTGQTSRSLSKSPAAGGGEAFTCRWPRAGEWGREALSSSWECYRLA